MNATLCDLELSVKSDDENAFNDHVKRYEENEIVINKYGDSSDVNSSGKALTDAVGNALTDYYVARGTLTISRVNKSNAHLQFRFNANNRFVLWDNSNDGVFAAGKIENGVSKHDKNSQDLKLYDANDGLTLEWAVVVQDDIAYWYINGELVQTINATTEFSYFNIGALQMDVVISDIQLYVKTENPDLYNKVVSEYLG